MGCSDGLMVSEAPRRWQLAGSEGQKGGKQKEQPGQDKKRSHLGYLITSSSGVAPPMEGRKHGLEVKTLELWFIRSTSLPHTSTGVGGAPHPVHNREMALLGTQS